MASIWELAIKIVQNQADAFDLDPDEIRAAIRLVHGTLNHLQYIEQHGIPLEVELTGKDRTLRRSNSLKQATDV